MLKIRIYSLLLGLMLSLGLSAQGWEQNYGGIAHDDASDLLPTADGGFYLLGSSASYSNGQMDFLLIKTGPNGEEEWTKTIGDSSWLEFGQSLQYTSDGNLIIGGTARQEEKTHVQITKADLLGNELWSIRSTQEDSVAGVSVIELASGGYLAVGNRSKRKWDNTGVSYLDTDLYLFKIDATGNYLNDRYYGGVRPEEGFSVLQQSPGTAIAAGYTRSMGDGGYDVYILEIDTQNDSLNLLRDLTFGSPNQELGYGAAKTSDGGYVVTGKQNVNDGTNENVFLLKLDNNLQEEWWQSYPLEDYENGQAVTQTADGSYLITGNIRFVSNSNRDPLVIKTDATGTALWTKSYGGNMSDGAVAIINSTNAGFALAGYTFSYGAGSSDAYLIKSDSLGISFSNIIYGNVYTDFDLDCDFDNGDQGIPQWTLRANGLLTRHALTDSAGNYKISVDTGNYDVQVYPTSSYWEPCEEIVSVYLPLPFDSVEVDFPVQPEIECPLMSVSISTPFLRRCFPNNYTLQYCNNGTDIAEDAYVDITFDSHLQVDTASVPYTSNGDTYTFQLGDVDLFECNSFKIYTQLDPNCSTTVLGQSHCVEAHIYPDSICQPIDPNWDGSSIEIDAVCAGDSIEFTLTNVGQGDMFDVQDYVIIEDHIMLFTGGYNLLSLQDTTIKVATSGGTFRLETSQSEGHPGENEPSASIEGCAEPFSTGFLTQLPQNDGNPFIDIDCQENTGSFDPNDKQAFPKGFDDEHFIKPNTDLEYLIRFQNTGTDTAFRVIIRDTLSFALDITNIQAGPGSHPYTFEIYDERILKFTFDNIMLPDSNVNELESHGFIKFKVAQILDNPIGTNIYNKAGIYFDYNEPVITNQTYHLVGENFIEVKFIDGTTDLFSNFKFYPNPFTEYITFEFESLQTSLAQPLSFHLYDLQGRLLRTETFQGHSFTFYRKNLASGLYLFRIENREGLISNGKIIIGR